MGEKIEPNVLLYCPECQAAIPEERYKTPWCECGWSSVEDEWKNRKIPARFHKRLVRDQETAHRLASIDERTSHLLSHPWGMWVWQLYLGIAIILCLPVIAFKVFFYGLVLAGWGYSIYLRLPIFVFLMAIITGGILIYRLLTRSKSDTPGILLNRQSVPQLFAVLDEVAARLQAAPINVVRLQLRPEVGIRQRWTWFRHTHFEKGLTIGLMDLYALNVIQLKSVIAHEFGHIKQKDTMVSVILNPALTALYDWTDMNNMGVLVEIVFFPLLIFLVLYFRLLVFVTRWAMRRQEYSADRIAAQVYGKSTLQQALISTGAIGRAFVEYIPNMMQKIDNDMDRRDFYSQFLDYWDKTSVTTRQQYYATAVASFSSVYDTHPSYQARRRALEKLDNLPAVETDNRPSLSYLPNATELGRELTIKMIKKARS